jgi:hypothetical protein
MTADKKQEQLDYTNRREIQQSIIDEALSRRCAYVMRANENNGHPTAASIKKGATTALRAITGKFEGQPNADDLKAQHQADVAKCNTIFKKYLPFEVRQEIIDMTAPEKWQHVLDYGKVGDAERVSALDRKMRETMFNQDRRYMEPFLKKMRAFHHQIMAINSTNHSKDQFFRVVLDNLGSCGQPEGTFYTTVTQLRGKSYLEDDDQEKLTWDILQSTLANLASQKSKSEGQEEEKAVLLSAIGKLDKRLSQQEKANAGGQSRRPGAPQFKGQVGSEATSRGYAITGSTMVSAHVATAGSGTTRILVVRGDATRGATRGAIRGATLPVDLKHAANGAALFLRNLKGKRRPWWLRRARTATRNEHGVGAAASAAAGGIPARRDLRMSTLSSHLTPLMPASPHPSTGERWLRG